uniref:ribosomal protein S3 n=1 Tax=Choristocarpus tenellus TaxID=116065 RepID=UPI002E75F1AC|nr:ribosomal protein S3 [Choristocarpus tenellus]WBP69812.1 ribosomal protein S3 [Choristocarpus tenellus]
MIAQQTHPSSLRPDYGASQGCAHWNHAQFHHLNIQITKLLQACARNTPIYIDELKLSRFHDFILIELKLIHLHPTAKNKRFKRKRATKKKTKKSASWPQLAFRFKKVQPIIQKLTGCKKIKFKIKRIKTYTREVPKIVRQKISFYIKRFNITKYPYARAGLQLINLVAQGKASALSLSFFLIKQLRSKQKRKRHFEFLKFLKEGFNSFVSKHKIEGLRIYIHGRYSHKPKGRSIKWKYQLGRLQLQQIQTPIQAIFKDTQTAYGSVGFKVWVCPNQKKRKKN